MKHEARIIQLIPDKDEAPKPLPIRKRRKYPRFQKENWHAPHKRVGSSWNGSGLAARSIKKKKIKLHTVLRTWNIDDNEWFAQHPVYGNN